MTADAQLGYPLELDLYGFWLNRASRIGDGADKSRISGELRNVCTDNPDAVSTALESLEVLT